ncbi:bifunctional PIG-L family deacetylase/class I SAM-dependent methyltransferase [Amycolatopsis azurea]|uniref:LmbE family protein n=1 Tax=Amycolatopsis azurea DSM 43854 TaxID=1238180 RepID=M2NMQ2_9PSEU|nr:bifunctional PIG-L family deacetylase/class I SAM-dependent methyltransferase [Amycolatopsis azurea]EMD23409.1 putative methyltransferase [Amycolatopsis azurea DSM 43854]OOC04907.1 LmbE family protein [Amycolatopsis azurea DSM 43854]
MAAHPDDETLGVSGLLQRLHARGAEIRLIVATDGEGAFPGSSADERRALGTRRRMELLEALRCQGMGDVEPVWAGLPDSALADHETALTGLVRELSVDSELCLAPWPDDPHPDHRAAGRAAFRAAPLGAYRWSYPIWLWHLGTPDDPGTPWARATQIRLDDGSAAVKAKAIQAFPSQLEPGPRGEDPILTPEILEHFTLGREILFHEPRSVSTPVSRFETLYREPDPWAMDSWYERRKRTIALAALPSERYGVAVEPACGTGALTVKLAARCDRVHAFDPVPAALSAARNRSAHLSTVDFTAGALPGDLKGPTDLVVLSEILYYLSEPDLTATLDRTLETLRPGGQVLAVHWRPQAPDAPHHGQEVHERLRTHPGLRPLVEHREDEFLVDVLTRR